MAIIEGPKNLRISGTAGQVDVSLSSYSVNDYKYEFGILVYSKSDRDIIRQSVRPGATANYSNIEAFPVFIDISGADTLEITPLGNLANFIDVITLGVISYSEEIISPDGVYLIKLTGYPISE